MELGEDARVKASDIVAKKVVFENSFNQSIRKNCGVEIEKSAFLKKYGHDKENIKGANLNSVRRRYFKTGRIKVGQVTIIHDLDEGEVRFEDIEGIGVDPAFSISPMISRTEQWTTQRTCYLGSSARSQGSDFWISLRPMIHYFQACHQFPQELLTPRRKVHMLTPALMMTSPLSSVPSARPRASNRYKAKS